MLQYHIHVTSNNRINMIKCNIFPRTTYSPETYMEIDSKFELYTHAKVCAHTMIEIMRFYNIYNFFISYKVFLTFYYCNNSTFSDFSQQYFLSLLQDCLLLNVTSFTFFTKTWFGCSKQLIFPLFQRSLVILSQLSLVSLH